MHLKFMNCCNENIFPELNKECSSSLKAEVPYGADKLHGKAEMLVNTLPSYLFLGEKFIIMIDFDSNNEEQLMKSIEDRLDKAKTKGTSTGHAYRIKITKRDGNVFHVLVGGKQKLIVIIPLGLPKLHPQFFKTHTVEDYVFEQTNDTTKLSSSESSKSALKTMKLQDGQITTHLKNGIKKHKDEIMNNLKPLWNN